MYIVCNINKLLTGYVVWSNIKTRLVPMTLL